MSDEKDTGRTVKKKSMFRILQKQMTRRRIWLAAAIVLYMILYYPVAVIMLIARANARSAAMGYGPLNTLSTRLGEVSTWIGIRQSFTWVIVIMGVVLAIQGYSCLFNMDKLDFYESQPVSRRQRFWNIYANGFLLFWIPMVICLFLSILAAGAMGAMNALTFGEAMLQMVRNTILFASSYSIGILAVMLTGNPVICTLVTAFLMLIDQVYAYLIRSFETTYYSTFCYFSSYGTRTPAAMFSPVYNCLTAGEVLATSAQRYGPITGSLFSYLVRAVWAGDLVNLTAAAVVLFISFRLYLVRKAEWAGHTVVFRPVSAVIRILTSVAAGLFAGTLIYSIYGSDVKTGGGLQVLLIIAILAVTVIAAGIIRIIHELNFWKFFAGTGEIIAAAVIAAVFFSVFRLDLFGYDRYVPDADKVASAALYVYSDRSREYTVPDDATGTFGDEDHVLSTMVLTDIESLEQITKPGMALKVQNDHMAYDTSTQTDGSEMTDEYYGWMADVCYRMKDGRKVYRSIMIPYSTDAAVLDRIVGSVAYRQGIFGVYDDSYIAQMAQNKPAKVSMIYSNGLSSTDMLSAGGSLVNGVYTITTDDGVKQTGNGQLYPGFADAYRRDLQKYDYSLASSEEAAGILTIQLQDSTYLTMEYPVYPSFTNTIRYLKDNGLYLAPPAEGDYSKVSVYAYDYSRETGVTVDYTDRDRIEEILSHCASTLESDWKKTTDWDLYYSVSATDRTGNLECYNYNFRSGEVPEFVKEDITNALAEQTGETGQEQ